MRGVSRGLPNRHSHPYTVMRRRLSGSRLPWLKPTGWQERGGRSVRVCGEPFRVFLYVPYFFWSIIYRASSGHRCRDTAFPACVCGAEHACMYFGNMLGCIPGTCQHVLQIYASMYLRNMPACIFLSCIEKMRRVPLGWFFLPPYRQKGIAWYAPSHAGLNCVQRNQTIRAKNRLLSLYSSEPTRLLQANMEGGQVNRIHPA